MTDLGRRLFNLAPALWSHPSWRYRLNKQSMVAICLMLVGTNLITYAATRYATTERVLKNAQTRFTSAITRFPSLQSQFNATNDAPLKLAIPMAGGMYYWYNDSLPYWGAGVFLTASGLLVPFVSARRRRPVPGVCEACGYDLRATPERCPECGKVASSTKGSAT